MAQNINPLEQSNRVDYSRTENGPLEGKSKNTIPIDFAQLVAPVTKQDDRNVLELSKREITPQITARYKGLFLRPSAGPATPGPKQVQDQLSGFKKLNQELDPQFQKRERMQASHRQFVVDTVAASAPPSLAATDLTKEDELVRKRPRQHLEDKENTAPQQAAKRKKEESVSVEDQVSKSIKLKEFGSLFTMMASLSPADRQECACRIYYACTERKDLKDRLEAISYRPALAQTMMLTLTLNQVIEQGWVEDFLKEIDGRVENEFKRLCYNILEEKIHANYKLGRRDSANQLCSKIIFYSSDFNVITRFVTLLSE